MADITGKLFIVQKHMKHRAGKKTVLRRRKLYDLEELEKAKGQAANLAEAYGEDFVVVQVLAEASKPDEKPER